MRRLTIKMHAAVLLNYGQPLAFDANIPKVVPFANEILIKVNAAGVNPADYKFAKGDLKSIFSLKLPAVLGLDFSGVVETVGTNVLDYNIGDAVYGFLTVDSLVKRGGSYAE